LEGVLASGRKLILVTGRDLPDLLNVFSQADLFHWVVAENGALLYHTSTRRQKLLADPPSPLLIRTLRERGVTPLSAGRVIVMTRHPQEKMVLDVIRDLGLELQIIFNKGAVMVLPSGVNKRTGLVAALCELGLSPRNAVGIGDAENDHAFLNLCECSIAVANALPLLKEQADVVLRAANGAGVTEVAEKLVSNDLLEYEPFLGRHRRKYAEGELGADKSFYFKGPEGKLNLRAQNLVIFTQVAQGVDDATWLYHLRKGDYSSWFTEAIKDDELASEVKQIEKDPGVSADESRALIKTAIEQRYTGSA
jgi:hydroxymethylpyrimidine pyrophosphatase-like HAD family hydrolase